MASVPVTFEDRWKRITLGDPSSFDELERRCRVKFCIPYVRIEIKAQVAGGKRFNVDDDEDLREVINDVEAFHIRCLGESSKAVVVAGDHYQIDQIPSSDSQLVQRMKAELESDVENIDDMPMAEKLTTICHVADLFHLAATAMPAHDDAEQVLDLQRSAYNIIVFLTQLSHDSDILYTKSKATCSSVLDSVTVAANYHLEGFDDIAAEELANLGGASREMVVQCRKILRRVAAGKALLTDLRNRVMDKRTTHEENQSTLKSLPTAIERKELDVGRKQEDLEDARSRAEQRQGNSGVTRDALHTATATSAGIAAAVAHFVGTGLIEGTLAMSMPVVGVPLQLISLTGGLLYACNKTIKDMNAEQGADEALIAERRRQEAEAKRELLDLEDKLPKLKTVDAQHIDLCIQTLQGQLDQLESTLISWASFWEKLAVMFFQKQADNEENFAKYPEMAEDRLRAMWRGRGFRTELVTYMARWVAFREHSEEMQRGIQANIGALHRLMERNLTREQAEQQLRNTAGRIGSWTKRKSTAQTAGDNDLSKARLPVQSSPGQEGNSSGRFVTRPELDEIRKWFEKQMERNGPAALYGKKLVGGNFSMSVIGPAGGEIGFADTVSLEIPEGALDKATVVHCFLPISSYKPDDETRGDLEEDFLDYAPTVNCGPDGIKFNKEVVIRVKPCELLKDAEEANTLGVLTREASDKEWKRHEEETVGLQGDWLTIRTDHFSDFRVGRSAEAGRPEMQHILMSTVIVTKNAREEMIDVMLVMTGNTPVLMQGYLSDLNKEHHKHPLNRGDYWLERRPEQHEDWRVLRNLGISVTLEGLKYTVNGESCTREISSDIIKALKQKGDHTKYKLEQAGLDGYTHICNLKLAQHDGGETPSSFCLPVRREDHLEKQPVTSFPISQVESASNLEDLALSGGFQVEDN